MAERKQLQRTLVVLLFVEVLQEEDGVVNGVFHGCEEKANGFLKQLAGIIFRMGDGMQRIGRKLRGFSGKP